MGSATSVDGIDDPTSDPRWNWTLGQTQFNWFKQTIQGSTATYKFVFAHHMLGGMDPYVRGGAVPAHMFEWGGYNDDGTWGFDTQRPTFGDDPIHQLMIDNGVSAFFHGHDHQFVHEERDGIVYQLVPQPSVDGYGFDLYVDSPYVISGGNLPNSGHVRVTVSPGEATVEYVRSEATSGGINGTVEYSYTVESGHCATIYLPIILNSTTTIDP
ncbi:unnamed protein product [marine sediment metagenome]|uniref:Calcineurin-like phosphoesterase domain-containing protein n=1 Tax=marine sediment metagenome TaxID=412755 RepID=X0YJU8_9ZZZZ